MLSSRACTLRCTWSARAASDAWSAKGDRGRAPASSQRARSFPLFQPFALLRTHRRFQPSGYFEDCVRSGAWQQSRVAIGFRCVCSRVPAGSFSRTCVGGKSRCSRIGSRPRGVRTRREEVGTAAPGVESFARSLPATFFVFGKPSVTRCVFRPSQYRSGRVQDRGSRRTVLRLRPPNPQVPRTDVRACKPSR